MIQGWLYPLIMLAISTGSGVLGTDFVKPGKPCSISTAVGCASNTTYSKCEKGTDDYHYWTSAQACPKDQVCALQQSGGGHGCGPAANGHG